MDELVTWLRAQLDARERELDEDERVAREAEAEDKSPWHYKPGDFGKIRSADGYTVVHVEDSTPGPATAEHIARWDPDRVLRNVATERADIAVKRQLLDDLGRELGDDDTSETARWYVQLLALPMAGRDGYREEWRP